MLNTHLRSLLLSLKSLAFTIGIFWTWLYPPSRAPLSLTFIWKVSRKCGILEMVTNQNEYMGRYIAQISISEWKMKLAWHRTQTDWKLSLRHACCTRTQCILQFLGQPHSGPSIYYLAYSQSTCELNQHQEHHTILCTYLPFVLNSSAGLTRLMSGPDSR